MNKKLCPISWLRETFWPIYGRENIKFLALLLMMSTSIFAYTILRILKDTYILSAPLASANSISFVKAYFVLPCSIIYMIFFCYLTNKISKQQVFFVSVLPLIIFFTLFYFVLFPNISFFHMSVENIKYYQDTYPALKNFIPVIGYWIFSLFYVFAELVGTVVITFLFWGFSNYCVTPKEAVRFYPLLASYSYFSFMISSVIQGGIYKMASKYPVRSKEYFDILFINFYLIVGSLILFLCIYYFINYYILPIDSPELVNNFKLKSKNKPSFIASMRTVIQSKYLMYIVVLIVCYGVTTNLIEVTWKELIRKEFNGVESAIGAYMSRFYFMTGIVTVCLGIINKSLLTRFGWGVSTSIVPLCLMLTSFFFFCLIVFGSYIPSWLLFGCSTSYIAMQVGFWQDNLAKGFRYGVLDPNMQMVYLPLDDELKLKGKASVDIIGSRLGKSMGSFLESTLSMIFKGADQIALAPIFMPIVMLSCGLWFASIFFLSASYSSLLKKKELEEAFKKK